MTDIVPPIRIEVKTKEVEEYLGRVNMGISIALVSTLVSATALTRKEVLENIRGGMTRGLGWAPFKPATVRRKIEKGRSLKGLIDSGRMFNSVQEKISRTALQARVVAGVNYASFQEKGTRKTPARPFFSPVPKKVEPMIQRIFEREIERAIS